MELNPTIPDCAAELVTFIAEGAARDADCVGLFLRDIGVWATPDEKLELPPNFLLHLGAALRLLSWEAQGFYFHRSEGQPEAKKAILNAFQALTNPNADPTQLCLTVLRLSGQHFAWHGRRELDADVALGGRIDDAALDAVVEYAWASRHAGNAAGSPKP